MTSAGRKLPDIYEAGSSKLKELDELQRSALKQAAESHLTDSGALQKTFLTQLKKRSDDFQTDLQAAVARSLQRLQKINDAEMEETKAHVQELVDRLSKLSTQFTQSINDIRACHQSKVTALQADTRDLHEREVETASVELQKHNYEASKTLKVQNTFVINSFQQKLEHALVEIRGEDRQLHNKLLKALLQSTNSIDAHVSTLMQKLSTEFQLLSESFAAKLEDSRSKLNCHIEESIHDADNLIAKVSEDINQAHETLTLECNTASQTDINVYANRVKSLCESNSGEISKVAEEHSRNLSAAGKSAQTLVAEKSAEVARVVDEALALHIAEFTNHRNSGLQLQHGLEERKEKICRRISQEFTGIEDTFKQKLNNILTKSTEQLTTSCNEALEAIFSAQQNHDKQLKSIAGAAKDQINSALSKFLERVNEKRESALQELKNAASGSTDVASKETTEAPNAKKNKKTKSKAEDKENQS